MTHLPENQPAVNQPLLAQATITEFLTKDAAWAESHGASGDYLGMGLLYYTLAYSLRARVAVCLGSGGGFVPRLMRQAQRDLGIAQSSRTILVDGNVPGAGWGAPNWLGPESFFRTQYPDVELVVDLTRNAAKGFFDKHGVSIDYLHIDADHSFEECYEDFRTFRRFLHEGSIVTLHDTNYPDAGVKQVIEHIRTLADCEVVDFADIGEGTALVRIGKSDGKERFRSMPVAATADENLISVDRRQDMPPAPPPTKEWKYLESDAFSTRYVLAAHFVRHCRSVVEIGGAMTPIDHFLTGEHDAVLVIDPLIRESFERTCRGRPCLVSHVRAQFQDVVWTIPAGADYGLVMLGLEFQGMAREHWEELFRLINSAQVTVIEFPMSWGPSRAQFELIRSQTNTRVVFQTELDLSDNDFGNLENSWPPRVDRMIYVLEPLTSGAAERQPPQNASQSRQEEITVPEPTLPAERLSIAPSGEPTDLVEQLKTSWASACAANSRAQGEWWSEGGLWEWQEGGVAATTSGAEWSNLEWRPWSHDGVQYPRNFVIELTVSGKAEAAGLSLGPYKDFLAPLDGTGEAHHLQLEVDADVQCWAFRVDSQLQCRCWWDVAVHTTDDLLDGVLTLKARNVQKVHFQDLTLHLFESSCTLSVIMTCYRFVQRMRLALRNWCHTSAPRGALEVLVVNPHSPDGTHEHLAAVARSFPHMRVRELEVPASTAKNKGHMINRAIAASQGEWIWLTDADCLFGPDSAATVLRHVDGHLNSLFFGQRRYLTAAQSDALLAGRLDSLRDFEELATAESPRPPENAPWGYTQIAHRSVLGRLRYSERLDHFAHSDGMFVETCRRQGIDVRQIPGLFCLHLDHPFSWYGAESFL